MCCNIANFVYWIIIGSRSSRTCCVKNVLVADNVVFLFRVSWFVNLLLLGKVSRRRNSDGRKWHHSLCCVVCSVTSKMSPNVYKSWPKMISLEKLKILTPFQKLPYNVEDLGKIIFPNCFESCPKSNKSPNLVGHTGYVWHGTLQLIQFVPIRPLFKIQRRK